MSDDDTNDEIISENDIFDNFKVSLRTIQEKIRDFLKVAKDLKKYVDTLDKDFTAICRACNKKTKRKSSTRKKLSGFAIPTRLSDDLYEFLNIEKGTLLARKEVTSLINEYIVKNGCRDETDKRKIKPNEELKKLLQPDDGELVTYFNLQRFLKKHFLK